MTIHSKDVLANAAKHAYPVEKLCDRSVLTSPDGYKFFVIDEALSDSSSDPVQQVELHVTNLEASQKYWQELLKMQKVEEHKGKSLVLSYGGKQASLRLTKLNDTLNRAKAYGRIAFAIPGAAQKPLFEAVQADGGTILKPLITLDTPGKATVTVLILADPDGHEICFVDEEGFSELSQVEPDGDARLDKYISKDPFQDKE